MRPSLSTGMAKKNDTLPLILSLLITLGLLGAGLWWFSKRLGPLTGGGTTTSAPGTGGTASGAPTALRDRFSDGGRLLFPQVSSAEKQMGIDAIAQKNYEQAIASFTQSLQINRNDPESLIYLNNSKIGAQQSYAIAIAVPAAASPNPAQELLRGVAQAQDEINRAGGISGVPLKVIIVDDDNTPETAAQVARELVKNDSVIGVIGHFGSDATLAAAPIYQEAGLVMISPTSTSTKVSELGDAIFRTVPSDRFTASVLSNHLINVMGVKNAAVFFNATSDYSRSLKDEFTTALYGSGGSIIGEFDLATSGFDAVAAFNQAEAQQAEVLVFTSNTPVIDQALQVIAVNRKRLKLLGGDSLYNPKLLQVGGDNAVDMVVAVPWDLLARLNSPFVRSSRSLWGADVNWRTAMAYDATQVFIKALTQSPTRQGVKDALNASSFAVEGATGQVRFLPSGDRNQAMELVRVKPGQRTGFGYEFVPVE